MDITDVYKRQLLHDIPLPILIGAGGNIMGGIVAWKQAKAIVVLGGENNPLAAGGLSLIHILVLNIVPT